MGGDGGLCVVVARAYLVVGLATACFALYAASSLHPAPAYPQLQLLQMIDSDKQHLEQGVAAAMQMRDDAVLMLLLGTAQGLMTMAAVVATSRVGTFLALLFGVPFAWRLAAVLAG